MKKKKVKNFGILIKHYKKSDNLYVQT